MSSPLPSSIQLPRQADYFYSLANMNKRVYPLNLPGYKYKESDTNPRPRPKEEVPEFIREYIKDSGLSKTKGNTQSTTKHTRSISYQNTPTPYSSTKTENRINTAIPSLSYKDFKNHHRNPSSDDRLFTPQIINITKRSKIILHASKPITINPSLYSQGKFSAHRKTTSMDKSAFGPEANIDISSVYEPGLTYGEKILKLKALVSSNIL